MSDAIGRRSRTERSGAGQSGEMTSVHALPSAVDEDTGAVSFAKTEDESTYGVVDEIVSRALR